VAFEKYHNSLSKLPIQSHRQRQEKKTKETKRTYVIQGKMKENNQLKLKKYKEQYNQLRKDMNDERSSETLRKYKILSKASLLGKIIHGRHFTYVTLAFDFELPYTTVKRVCSLSKANKNTWKKIKSGKISAFKVAQICSTKCITYQDEIVDLVIEKNYSTYQIKELKINSSKDIKKEKLKLAVEKGFSRKSSAFLSLCITIGRMETLLLMNKNHLPTKKYSLLSKKLKSLDKQIKEFIKRLE